MKTSLNSMSVSSRTAITLFLILLWYGYLLAVLNTRLYVGLNAESIADHYADHSLSKSEAQDIEQKGFSEEEVDLDNPENPPLTKGGHGGVPSGENSEQKQEVRTTTEIPSPLTGESQGGGEQWPSSAEHNHHANHEPDYAKEGAKKGNGTITPQEIVQLGHIHMLGFSLLFVSLGIILSLTGISEILKVIILLILFISFGLDIGGLLLVRFISPSLAILTVISGIGTGICMAVISLVAMYDMWVRKSSVMERS